MRRLSQPKVVLFCSLVVAGASSLSACKTKTEPAQVDVAAAKAAANQTLGELRTQVEKVQKAVTNAHGRLKALPEDLQGLEPMRSQLLSVEEVQGVEEARVKWLSGEIETAATAGNREKLEKTLETARGAIAGSKGVEKSVAELTEKLAPFEAKVAQIQAIAAKGDVFKASLPSLSEIFGAKNGLENQLVEFIDNDKKKVDKKAWFPFDRIGFAANEARLVPEQSRHQLENVATLLLAYPRVKLALGTYVGGAASAEAKTLSQARVEAVQAALVTLGVAAPRLSVEAHDPAAPVCKGKDAQAVEECKANSQRILARVTAK
jgi:outer membrane protein OmpA-like peptidoglycan-associated protein